MKKIGRYDIIEELGRGAMGVVYKGSDPTIGRLVAIKILSLSPSMDIEKSRGLEMLMREARAAGRLSHPGIVTIYDAVEDAETRASYIVMELVRGRTLDEVLAVGERFAIDRALDIAGQIAEALDYAHGQNVVHRDLKPANILLTDDDRAKIADFGIAKFAGQVGTVQTDTVMGTPSHMSPEQVTRAKVDARSDLFSLGIILYSMLTGRKPFEGDTAAVLFKIVYEDPLLPSKLNPELTRAHDYFLMRCMAKDCDKRYATARKLLDDLEDVRQGRTPRSETEFSISELLVGQPAVAGKTGVVARPSTPKFGVRTKAGVGALLLFVLGALLGWKVWMTRHRNKASLPLAAAQSTLSGAAPPTTSAASQIPAEANAPRSPSSSTSPAAAASHVPFRVTPARAVKVRTAPSKSPTIGKVVQLVCRHELEQARLTVSAGRNIILAANLNGRRKAALLGIKGGYTGTLSRPLTIPLDAKELSVHIISADRSVDLTNTISATSASGPLATLYVAINGASLDLSWGVRQAHKP